MNKKFKLNEVIIVLLVLGLTAGCSSEKDNAINKAPGLAEIAPTPPLGWNSYDCYNWRVNEEEFKANVDFMAENLLSHGYEYAVVDFLWYIVDSLGDKPLAERGKNSRILKYDTDGNLTSMVTIDQYGRYLPETVRFPSAKDGNGFKTLADYTHSKGLKFGIHIMRGVPRVAVQKKLPIKGTNFTAADIAEKYDTCSWENSMYGIDFEAEGAQEYYNSLIELYAGWGVDFIKADDIMAPWHPEEIKMIRRAIEKSGRPIVLSLSFGEPRFSEAEMLCEYSNMWRISGDFWDNWDQIVDQFNLTKYWAKYSQPGNWPDADMLPVGHLSLDNFKGKERMSNFTWPEHYTLLSLWSIVKSPLMIGGNLPASPDSTLFFLTNDEVLYVNQQSENGQELYRDWNNNTIVWLADDINSDDRFFAIFNIGEKEQEITFDFEQAHLRDTYQIRDLWHHKDLGKYKSSFTETLPPHGAGLYRMTEIL